MLLDVDEAELGVALLDGEQALSLLLEIVLEGTQFGYHFCRERESGKQRKWKV